MIEKKQAEKLKSREMKEGWMKNDEWWRMKKEWWRMMISSYWGVLITDGQTDRVMDGMWMYSCFAIEISIKKFQIENV